MSTNSLQVVESFISCVKAGDGEGALAQLADDVTIVEAGSIPHEGTFEGKDGVGDLLQQIDTTFGGLELSEESFHDARDFIVARFTATFHSKSTSDQVTCG